ncbi:ACT domain-containing protein [Lyticum sinuosum]|uniref:GTP pyrophosphokinase n=1 Tax=Lyticum sinuosum TaxID=1332059 RepID=A0AAE4VMH1_9RICK|nr:ACT domain-containing protein [Lyticum sinuosum]MDZ5761529.1 Bifunctional (p)ppGpp synthetase/guanosine-3',5'-bis(diphosphate) 3'-pyrophosphohydrolase [Lyticum sinuosum]
MSNKNYFYVNEKLKFLEKTILSRINDLYSQNDIIEIETALSILNQLTIKISQIDQERKSYYINIDSNYNNLCKNQLITKVKNINFNNHVILSNYVFSELKIEISLKIAIYLIDIHTDVKTIISAILQNCHLLSKEYITEIKTKITSNNKIFLISKRLSKLEHAYKDIKNVQNNCKAYNSFLSIAKDNRTILILLAQILYRAESEINNLSSTEKHKFICALEYIYIPLASKIKVQYFKNRLENILFFEKNPTLYKSINNRLNLLKQNNNIDIHDFIIELTSLISQEGIDFRIEGREKTVYSIWKKMKKKQIPFEKIFDIFGFRIITSDIKDCYIFLALIHTKYKVNSHEFTDYISVPKSNNYQSLHTIIYFNNNKNSALEIQIRTAKMHKIAEFGLASHWHYKSGYKYSSFLDQKIIIYNNKEESNNKEENNIQENFNIDYIHHNYIKKNIFCFIPYGKMISLPEGSTALDFAFIVHSRIAKRALYAKINNLVRTLNTRLFNGDCVKIVQSLNDQQNHHWLTHNITKSEDIDIINNKKLVKIGKTSLLNYLSQKKIVYDENIFVNNLEYFKCQNIEEFFYKIGIKDLSLNDIVNSILYNKTSQKFVKEFFFSFKNIIKNFIKNIKNIQKNNANSVIIKNFYALKKNTNIKFSKCCCPVPGDEIICIVNKKEEFQVHHIKCKKIKYDKEIINIIDVSWSNIIAQKSNFYCRIEMLISDKSGSLANVLLTISELKINVNDIIIDHKNVNISKIILSIEVKCAKQLNCLIDKIKKMSNVYKCKRYFKI